MFTEGPSKGRCLYGGPFTGYEYAAAPDEELTIKMAIKLLDQKRATD